MRTCTCCANVRTTVQPGPTATMGRWFSRLGARLQAAVASISVWHGADHLDEATLRDLGAGYRDIRMQRAALDGRRVPGSLGNWL